MGAILSGPWPFWASGVSIGLFVVFLAWVSGRGLGVSSAYAQLCDLGKPGQDYWKLSLALGIPLGGLLAATLSGTLEPSFELGMFEQHLSDLTWIKVLVLFLGGICLGYGARWAGGCTSGHAIMGMAQGAKASLIVTSGFMIAGVVVTRAIYWIGALV